MAIEEITQTPTLLSARPDKANLENKGFTTGSAEEAVASLNKGAPKTAEADYSFWDFLDLINPLQHIPVVNTIYREITGDTIKPEMKLAGSTVLGGVFGFVTGLADVIFEQETGKDISSTLVASVFGDGKDAPVQTAKAESKQAVVASIEPAPYLPTALPIPATNTQRKKSDERAERLASINPMDKHVLELYGKSNPAAASQAYNQANMRAYLQQASLNQSF